MALIVPGSEPFLRLGGPVGCLLLHGFTAMPAEMGFLGDYLAERGYTVLGVRLAGHATHPQDLARVRWRDWLISVEDGLSLLGGAVDEIFVVGQSMGGLVALAAAARYPMSGVVAVSTPFWGFSKRERIWWQVRRRVHPMIDKQVPAAPPPLNHRCEAGYPAYPRFPSRVLLELDRLQREMTNSLTHVDIPVLLIHSRADRSMPFQSMEQIYEGLATADKEAFVIEDADHSVVCDPLRELAFDAIDRFARRVIERRRDDGVG